MLAVDPHPPFAAPAGAEPFPRWHTQTSTIEAPRDDWDAFLSAAPHGDIVQSSIWVLSKRALGQTATLVEARDMAGAIVGGALMIHRKVGPGLGVGYVPRGPVVRGDDPSLFQFVLDEVTRARPRGVHGLIVQLPQGDLVRDQILADAGFSASPMAVAAEATIQIDVTRSDEAILVAMSSSRRRHVRQSWKESIEIAESDDLATFHRLHGATGRRKTFDPLPLDYLEAQWQALRPSKAATILVARQNGEAVAGLWLTRFGACVTLRLSGWNVAATRSKHVNEALRWAAIQWTRSVGARIFDFGGFDRDVAECVLQGRPVPDAFARSHASFKLGFNPVPVLLPRAWLKVFGPGMDRVMRLVGPTLLAAPAAGRYLRRLRNG